MTTGIRGRIFTWLAIAVVPVLLVSLLATSLVESRLAERSSNNLGDVARVEAASIERTLVNYRADADRLATAVYASVLELKTQPAGARSDQLDRDLADAGTAVAEVYIVDASGAPRGQSSGYDWQPGWPELVTQVLDGVAASYGESFTDGQGNSRIGLVTPIKDPDGAVAGAMLAEVDISAVFEALRLHRQSGPSSEAFLVQLGPDGQARYASPLRFANDFSAAASPFDMSSAENRALNAPETLTLAGADYRGVDSLYAVESIDGTGWGLVVRVDADEAQAISRSVRTLMLLGSLASVAALLLGWALLLRPLVGRIRSAAEAADRVASGDYSSRIDDRLQDEIGDVSRGIDRLAADLEFDGRMRNDAERRLRYQATHDELTNIFNRQHMTALIRDSLRSGQDYSVSLLFLDLDDFKLVNDLWGHAVGDEVLAAVANRLRRLVGNGVLISRWGGDEFTVVIKNADRTTIEALANRVRSLFQQPINTSVGPQPIACSVGVATAFAGDDLDQLLHDADARMFEEKQSNRKSRMIAPETARLVEMALADGRVEVHYQPIVELVSVSETRLHALEALVRIRAIDGTLREPSEFLPEVLGHRYASDIDRTIATMALNDVARWRRSGLLPVDFSLALNLSPASMRSPTLDDTLAELAASTESDPLSIILELSEEADDLAPGVARGLQRMGFRFAVDDLGLKRSNLDRLLNGPVDIAKLDRRWFQEPVVFDALVRTCEEKGVTVISEGVETAEQMAMLFASGVRLCQGFYIARPMSSEAVTTMLSTGEIPNRR